MVKALRTHTEENPSSNAGRIAGMLVGWLVAVLAILVPNWVSMSEWLKHTLLVLVVILSLVSLSLGVGPCTRVLRNWHSAIRTKRRDRYLLLELAEKVHESKPLLDSDGSFSMRDYVHHVSVAASADPDLQRKLVDLYKRLNVLADSHYVLLTFAYGGFRVSAPLAKVKIAVVMFYSGVSDVVGDMVRLRSDMKPYAQASDVNRRKMESRYNDHIGAVERLLETMNKADSEIRATTFNRF